MKQVHFLEWTCNVLLHQYPNGRTAVQLYTETGEPVATASINMPGYPLKHGEVLIKDYAENTGILACLSSAGIIEPTGKTIPVGHTQAHVCRLLKTEITH